MRLNLTVSFLPPLVIMSNVPILAAFVLGEVAGSQSRKVTPMKDSSFLDVIQDVVGLPSQS